MLDRRNFVLGTLASSTLVACGGGGGSSIGSGAATATNRYRQANLLASHARHGARFTEPEFINGWGIAIRPAGAGGHFWVGGGGISWQYLGDVTRSTDPA